MKIKVAIFDMDGTLVDSLTAIETATKIGFPTVGIYAKYNFGQEQIKQIATRYIGLDETLLNLVE